MKNIIFKTGGLFAVLAIMCLAFASCEGEYPLPEAGSIADATLPSADFGFAQTDPEDYRVVSFSDQSASATDVTWDFGTGDTSTEKNPDYTYEAGEGTYTVTMTVSDKNGVSDAVTRDIEVIEPEEPDAIVPDVVNGDFTAGQDGWKFSSFTGGKTDPFNSSSDGSNLNYDGSDNGSKTAGAKWTMSTSAEDYVSGNTRYAYQAFTVSAETEYVLEYEYAIKNDGTQAPGVGNRIVGGIIDGHFEDGATGVSSFNEGALLKFTGSEDLGKGNFTLVKETFTSNASGQIAILIYGVTDVDAYVDNVKLYPAE